MVRVRDDVCRVTWIPFEHLSCQQRSLSLLSCCRQPHLSPKLTGFQNWFFFNVEWAFPVQTAETGNFWAHSSYRANRFCKLCRTWLKRCWLLRKRQCMRDRKRIGGLQRSLFFLLLLLTWETHAGKSNIRKTVFLWETFFFFFSSSMGSLFEPNSARAEWFWKTECLKQQQGLRCRAGFYSFQLCSIKKIRKRLVTIVNSFR